MTSAAIRDSNGCPSYPKDLLHLKAILVCWVWKPSWLFGETMTTQWKCFLNATGLGKWNAEIKIMHWVVMVSRNYRFTHPTNQYDSLKSTVLQDCWFITVEGPRWPPLRAWLSNREGLVLVWSGGEDSVTAELTCRRKRWIINPLEDGLVWAL